MRAPSEAIITAEIWTTPKREKVRSWGCTLGAMKLINFFRLYKALLYNGRHLNNSEALFDLGKTLYLEALIVVCILREIDL